MKSNHISITEFTTLLYYCFC